MKNSKALTEKICSQCGKHIEVKDGKFTFHTDTEQKVCLGSQSNSENAHRTIMKFDL